MGMVVTVEEVPEHGDRVVFVRKGGFGKEEVPQEEFDGEKLATLIWREKRRRIVYVGLGDGSVTADLLRKAAGTGVKLLRKLGGEEIHLDCTAYPEFAGFAAEGALLASYRFEDFRMPDARKKSALRTITVAVGKGRIDQYRREVERSEILAEAVNYVRQLGNQPANVVTPAVLADRALELAGECHLQCNAMGPKELEEGGFGGILAVGRGSENSPRLIVLEHRPTDAKPIVIVGKAVTFDSGGISIKPGEHMDEMKFDKMGGCAVLGILRAASRLGLSVPIVGVIASAENMPSARAYRPGDLIRSYGGKTIEVLNTDAEGRILLADAVGYAVERYAPRLLFDLATLTGACIVALGRHRAGVFTPDLGLRDQLWHLGELAGEPVWPLPLGEEFEDAIRSDVALVKNVSGTREGGGSVGAAFIRHWIGDTPWVHLDIAGPAWTNRELPYLEKGVTGFGVRLLTRYLLSLVAQEKNA
ncbi:leucyl aminopeptidase [Methylacidimicrobium cyclopophantes]|uniref:Probable cytosol aminopeptidase n=1 Tax=Methylacidimicrobium cyclopophantes TaxID=1041766 RepID=A0A5E6M837_9BACT|nr:leucyl aminopeptidase [Methylacidimicrobium cyclopophantes]VVM05523.1 leucyl aminopeptidase [Methylacidimicrobium cyclopophantes]